MNKPTAESVLPLLTLGLLCLSIISIADAGGNTLGNPTLEDARVTPENGPWGSVFTFEVIYVDDENNMPMVGYPKVYIDGVLENMSAKDPTDTDVTDGKVYTYEWTASREDVGPHNFYCYVETVVGENARDPATGSHEGPTVERVPVLLSCQVDALEPGVGGTVTFSGYMTTEENLGVEGENLGVYKLLFDEDVFVGQITTGENGRFVLSLGNLDQGVLCYRVRFPGDNYFEMSESPRVYVNTLDKPLVLWTWVTVLLVLVGGMMYLCSRGIPRAHYLTPVLWGFCLGFFLTFMGAASIGIMAGGAIAGYIFAKTTPKRTTHLRIGCMTGFIFLLVVGVAFTYFFVEFPELFGLKYSLTQIEVFRLLASVAFYNLVYFSLLAGLGAVLGGVLRKLFAPSQERAQIRPDTRSQT
jgi:hypothetical protein